MGIPGYFNRNASFEPTKQALLILSNLIDHNLIARELLPRKIPTQLPAKPHGHRAPTPPRPDLAAPETQNPRHHQGWVADRVRVLPFTLTWFPHHHGSRPRYVDDFASGPRLLGL